MDNIKFKIIVGEGTCGIAAGSTEILKTFRELAPKIDVQSVGCIGMCHQEVIVEIRNEHNQSWFYGQITPKNVPEILNYHTGKGALPVDLLLMSSEFPKQEKGQFLTQQTRIALRNVGYLDPTSLEHYQQRNGYNAIKKILNHQLTPENIIEEIKISGLRGRGGGGFPTHIKWNFARQADGDIKYLICNGDEGDPGAFMDRSLLEGDPHNILEGMLIAAYAIGASQGYAYIRAEYPLAVKNFTKAIQDAKAINLLGQNILGSNFSFELKVKQGAGAFVCGEETALIGSIEGKRGMPRIRPPFPAISGLFNKPTIINNVETYANLPWIILNGGKKYASYGVNQSKGTKVFALAGTIKKGGLVEVPMGTTIHDIVYKIGGGSSSDYPIKAVQLGGPSGGCIPAALFDIPIEYETINATGAIMGSGGMIVMDEKTCMVDLAKFFLDFTQLESCGKCTFCRVGTLRMKELLEKICLGEANLDDLAKLEVLVEQIKQSSLCGLGQTAPNPVATTLKYFRDEYLAHIQEKRCPAGVCKALINHTIIPEKCTACSLCMRQCPTNAISKLPNSKFYQIDQKLCINCGMCVQSCKFKAITVQ